MGAIRNRERGNGQGSVVPYVRNGQQAGWRATVTVGRRESGEQDRRTRVFEKKTDASRWLREQLGARDTGAVTRPGADKLTLRTFLLEIWLPSIEPREGVANSIRLSTYLDYKRCAEKHLVPLLGQKKLTALEVADVETAYRRYADRPRLALYLHQTIRRALGKAKKDRYVVVNVAEEATAIRPQKTIVPTPDAQTLALFLRQAEARGDRLLALWATLTYTGCRPSEALGLWWSDVDWERRTLRIERTVSTRTALAGRIEGTKTESSRREIGVEPELLEYLKAHRARQNEARLRAGGAWRDQDVVFANRTGGVLLWNNVRADFRRALTAAGIQERYRPYALRHAHVTTLVEQGESLELVGKRVGHASPAVTGQVYAHLLPKHDRVLSRSFGDAMKKAAALG